MHADEAAAALDVGREPLAPGRVSTLPLVERNTTAAYRSSGSSSAAGSSRAWTAKPPKARRAAMPAGMDSCR